MTTVAYIANEFPSALEPYVMDEINELRRRGINVVCCSGKRVAPNTLTLAERAFWKETLYCQPFSDDQLMRAVRRLASDRQMAWPLLRALFVARNTSPTRRIRTFGHTLMGAALAEQLSGMNIEHIHCHHGYFASWMALVAARLLGIDFSITLHGSDVLRRADLLEAKLAACKFCVTVSEFNRQYLLRKFPSIQPAKVLVQRLGVDRVISRPLPPRLNDERRTFCLLAVGRLHPVKNYGFLIEACAALRSRGLNFLCWIAGEGSERRALERQIVRLGLQSRVRLVGHIPRRDLVGFYSHADLVVMTSKSEGIPVALMEAMSCRKIVLAPQITGIPELVEHQRTGFLYPPDSLEDFVDSVCRIHANHVETNGDALGAIQRAAAAKVEDSFHRQRNVRAFADHFLELIPQADGDYENSVRQQI
ncbi:MAG: glycosyltransferase family 4 protein [Terriglobales bacterium]